MKYFSSKDIKSAVVSNVVLQIMPIAAALFSVPYTINSFGKELFAVYALAVAFIVGLNYLHLGVATNVSRDLAAIDPADTSTQAEVFWTGLVAMIIISFLLLLIFSLPISYYTDSLSAQFIDDMQPIERFFRTTVYQIPLVLVLIFFRAVLESRLKFSITALNRALVNTLLLSAPVIAAFFGIPFASIALLFLMVHILSFLYLTFCCRNFFAMPLPPLRLSQFYALLKSGVSITMVSIGVLLFLYCDRYILSTSNNLAQVAYFIAPFDVLTRISFIYGSIGSVFFPVFARLVGSKAYFEFMKMIDISYWLIFIVVGFLVYVAIIFSENLLELWLGETFAYNSAAITNLLALGIIFTALTAIPNRALIALKQERIMGYVYFFGSILYVLFSFFLINNYGAIGAAYAFLTRSIIELGVLNILLSYKSKALDLKSGRTYSKSFYYSSAPSVLLLAFLLLDLSVTTKIIFAITLGVFSSFFIVHGWRTFRRL